MISAAVYRLDRDLPWGRGILASIAFCDERDPAAVNYLTFATCQFWQHALNSNKPRILGYVWLGSGNAVSLFHRLGAKVV